MVFVETMGNNSSSIVKLALQHPKLQAFESCELVGPDQTLAKNAEDLFGAVAVPNLLMRQAARLPKVNDALSLAHAARGFGIYTSLAILLQSPFEGVAAFLKDAENKDAAKSVEERFSAWLSHYCEGLKAVTNHARSFHVRILTEDAFKAAPMQELARLMALVPLPLYKSQLMSLRNGTLQATAKQVGVRDEDVQQTMSRLRGADRYELALSLHHIVKDRACREPDATTLDRLTRAMA